jgi:hypothetical protein
MALDDLPLTFPASSRFQKAFRRQVWVEGRLSLELGQATLRVPLPIEEVSRRLGAQGQPTKEKVQEEGSVRLLYTWEEKEGRSRRQIWVWLRNEEEATIAHLRWVIRYRERPTGGR